jgi:hypothetical protein
VKDLEASKLGLIEMATTYGYDESDKLDEMEATFAGEKFCELVLLSLLLPSYHCCYQTVPIYQDRLRTPIKCGKHDRGSSFCLCLSRSPEESLPKYSYLLRGIYIQTPLRFKLGGRPILSARLNVETARSERKRPEI